MSYPETIAGCCRELLDSSPESRSLEELTALAVSAGRTVARYPELSVASALRADKAVLALDGQRFLSVARLPEGRVFTTATGRGSRFAHALWKPLSRDDAIRELDLGPLLRLQDFVVDDSEADETAVLAFRLVDEHLEVETVPRKGLVEAPEFVASMRRVRERRSGYYPRTDEVSELLLACVADDSLFRRPAKPLSELLPELRPQEPELPLPGSRACRTCDGSGVEPDRDDDVGWEPGIPEAWRRRIERLEAATFAW